MTYPRKFFKTFEEAYRDMEEERAYLAEEYDPTKLDGPPTGMRPWTVTLAEAGAHSHLSVATIRRRLKAEQIPGAVRNADRSWSIPVTSLWAEGIWARGTWPAEPPDR